MPDYEDEDCTGCLFSYRNDKLRCSHTGLDPHGDLPEAGCRCKLFFPTPLVRIAIALEKHMNGMRHGIEVMLDIRDLMKRR